MQETGSLRHFRPAAPGLPQQRHLTRGFVARGRRICAVGASTQYQRSVGEVEWISQLQPGEARSVWRASAQVTALPAGSSVFARTGNVQVSDELRALALRLTADPDALTAASGAGWWDALPARYRVVAATSLSFVVCNMDKVNISIAILPMAHEFGWSPSVTGLVQSSFFWGYALSQIPGGYLTARIGGRTVLPGGVALWSGATAALPLLAGSLPGLCLSRALVGLGEGVAPSAATDAVTRVVSDTERARAVSFMFSGLHVGSLAGLLAAPPLIEAFGWRSVFYLFGGVGLVWVLFWESTINSAARTEPRTIAALAPNAPRLFDAADRAAAAAAQQPAAKPEADDPPFRAILRSRAFRALAFAHLTNNWFHYTMLAWLPTYFTDTLSLDLTHTARLSLLPPLAAIAVSSVAGTAADALLAAGVPKPAVRKGAQAIAFLVPAACLACTAADVGGDAKVALVTAALGISSFSLAGLYCNHADLSPRHAPLMLGMTNTAAAIPGIFGVASVGLLLDATGDWTLALFAPAIGLFLTGTAIFTLYGSTERQAFEDNSPFGWELAMRKHLAAARLSLGGGAGDAGRAKPEGGPLAWLRAQLLARR